MLNMCVTSKHLKVNKADRNACQLDDWFDYRINRNVCSSTYILLLYLREISMN